LALFNWINRKNTLMTNKNQTLLIALALFCTYFFWGSTYLALRFGIESFPPFMLVGLRFTIAGAILYAVMRYLGAPNPTKQQWLGATAVGILLPALGNGTVTYVQQTVSSSVAALAISTAPIWMAIFSSIYGHKINAREWLGIAVGFAGIVLLNLGGSLHGDFFSAFLLIFAAACWSLGSVLGNHLVMPSGLMAAASQMLMGGVVMLAASALRGETWPTQISTKSWGALVFLVVLGSLVTYSAYMYLLKTVRPLVASSNTFVNPVVAFAVGIWLANETVTSTEYAALAVILVGVFLVLTANNEESLISRR
jgi:drug/metabolite transporter (DMT)-like permease